MIWPELNELDVRQATASITYEGLDINDESFIDVHSVLDRPEKWARESLRNDGYSDAFIDEWIQVDDGLPLEVALELISSECDLKLMLIRHIQHLRDQLSNGDQTPMDWIWGGYLISWFQFMGSLNENEELWFSELQRANQKGTRNRITLPKMAMEYILQVAPLDTTQERGRDIERLRHFVGESCRIKVNGTTIEITSVEDDANGTIIGYVFDNQDLSSNEIPDMTPMSTIYSIIFRLNNKLSEKSEQSR